MKNDLSCQVRLLSFLFFYLTFVLRLENVYRTIYALALDSYRGEKYFHCSKNKFTSDGPFRIVRCNHILLGSGGQKRKNALSETVEIITNQKYNTDKGAKG